MRAHEPQPEDLPDHSATEEAPSAASQLFDLRTIIAILFIFYGGILTITVISTPQGWRVARYEKA